MITHPKLGTPVLVYYRNAIHGGILVSKQTTLDAGEERKTLIAKIDQDGYPDGFAAEFAPEDVVEATYNLEMGAFIAEKLGTEALAARGAEMLRKPAPPAPEPVTPAPFNPQDHEPL